MGVIYWVIRGFGSEAQAGFGIGMRVMQSIFLPAIAVAFATAPVAGQNFGAGRHDRTRSTFRVAAVIGSVLMLALALVCQFEADALVRIFTREAAVIAVSSEFLHIISWNFVATGIIFTCSSMFQALGNTVPSVVSSATRIVTFAVPAMWLSTRPGFVLRQVWILSVLTVALQLALSLLLLRREFRRKLVAPATSLAAAPAGA
jgi:Na+-driven multidrug efflux pump